jgi:hypothetical protein
MLEDAADNVVPVPRPAEVGEADVPEEGTQTLGQGVD